MYATRISERNSQKVTEQFKIKCAMDILKVLYINLLLYFEFTSNIVNKQKTLVNLITKNNFKNT